MAAPEPEFWREISGWLAAVLTAPVAWLWARVNSTVQKDDFKDFCQRFDQHCRDDREVQAKLFDKIDDLKTTIMERMDR